MSTSIHEIKQAIIDFLDNKLSAQQLADIAGMRRFHGVDQQRAETAESVSVQMFMAMIAEKDHEIKGMRDALSGQPREAISDAYVRGYDGATQSAVLVELARRADRLSETLTIRASEASRYVKIENAAKSLVEAADDRFSPRESAVIDEEIDTLRKALQP